MLRNDLKCQCQQSVAREDRGRLIELLVIGRTTAPEVVVIHRRQVVMNQRVSMNQLDRDSRRQCLLDRPAARFARHQHEHRSQSFAAGLDAVTHRRLQSLGAIRAEREVLSERKFDLSPQVFEMLFE